MLITNSRFQFSGFVFAILLLVSLACGESLEKSNLQEQGTSVKVIGPDTVSISSSDKTNVDEIEKTTPSFTSDQIVEAYESILGEIYSTSLPSIVRIEISRSMSSNQSNLDSIPPQFRRFFNPNDVPRRNVPNGQGSGFVWTANGHIVTNHHVVDGADRIKVIFSEGTEYNATILGSDATADIAVLKIDSPDADFIPLSLGDSSSVKVGQLAIAIGAPFGQEFTMTTGIISALGRTIPSAGTPFANPEVIQTDAPIKPGNSGGPLFDRHGNAIGINSQIASRRGSSAGVGFSVPIDTAKRIVPELIEIGKYTYSYLGIQGIDLRPDMALAKGLDRTTRGVLVISTLDDNGPAARAGIIPNDEVVQIEGQRYPVGGDVITSVEGSQITGMADLLTYLTNETRPGDKISFEIIRRDGNKAKLDVILGVRPT